uniref:HMG box domain-containing protein n=1 Tax=viral metagenome TaxID=1070528 RepID=A0A6C0JVT6_9ZZZZ
MAATRKMKDSKKATRKGKRAPSEWNKLVMKVYNELKKKDKKASFSDALKEAASRKKNM